MDVKLKLLYFALDILCPLVVGYALRRWKKQVEPAFDWLMLFNLMALCCLLGLLSFWVMPLQIKLMWVPLMGIAMRLVPAGVCLLIARYKFEGDLERGSYVLSGTLSNRGVAGMLTVFILYGEMGYALNRLIMLLAPLMFYGVWLPLGRYFHDRHGGRDGNGPSLGSILFSRNQIPLIGVAVGLGLNVAGIQRPAFVGGILPWMVHGVAWLFLLPVGLALDFSEMRKYWLLVADLLPIRFVLGPVCIAALAWAAGFRGTELEIITIIAASPTAVNAVVVAKLEKLNVHLSTAAFVLTTLVYVVVVLPVILFLFG